jgi:phosphatidate phosphatase APP1
LHSFLAEEGKTMTQRIAWFHHWLLAVGGPALFSTITLAADLKKDEAIVFFPTLAHLSEDGRTWTTRVHGWIFEPEADGVLRNAAIASFRNALGLSADEAESLVFQQRARAFLADNERGKRIAIRIGESMFELEPSAEDGHFFGTVQLDAPIVKRLARDGRLRYTAVTDRRDPRVFAGDIHLIDPAGVSVISDIDDTIKVTEVTDRKKLLQNTFLLPFRAVDGMADVYRRWSSGGAKFHFVSASPWQLYEPLAEFARQAGFPAATFHLRQIRLKDSSVLSLLADPLEAKLQMIEPLMATFPHRRFILVGDSGERDPEIYGRIAEKHPDQVLRIYIRDVTGQAAQSPRYQAAFGQLPTDKWQLFQEPSAMQDRSIPDGDW